MLQRSYEHCKHKTQKLEQKNLRNWKFSSLALAFLTFVVMQHTDNNLSLSRFN